MAFPDGLYTLPTFTGDCDQTFVLPTTDFNDCPEAVEQDKSEIAGVIIALPDAADPNVAAITVVDETDLAEWEIHLATANADHYYGIGDKPKPEFTNRVISRGRETRGEKNFVLNFDIDETTDENYETMRNYEGKPTVFMWYYTLGNKIYGGTTGIKCTVDEADAVNARGADSYEVYPLIFKWRSKGHPPRNTSPFTL